MSPYWQQGLIVLAAAGLAPLPGSEADFPSMTKMFNFGIFFFFFNYVAGNYLGYVENRASGVHVTKREKKILKIAGRVSQNKTFSLSLLCLCFPPPFFFPVFSVVRPTFLCLQVTLWLKLKLINQLKSSHLQLTAGPWKHGYKGSFMPLCKEGINYRSTCCPWTRFCFAGWYLIFGAYC